MRHRSWPQLPRSKLSALAFAHHHASRFDESTPWQPGAVGYDVLAAWAARLVNPARLASARSKVGTAPAAIRDEVVLDVAIDLEHAFGDGWRALGAAAQDRLLAHVAALAAALLAA